MCLLYLVVFWMLFPSSFAAKKDIVFLLDRSSSLSQQDVNGAIDFIYNVTSYMDIGSNNIQISVVSFSDHVQTEINLAEYGTKRELLSAIDNLRNIEPSGGTYTFTALQYVRNITFASSGSRKDAEKIVVVMTDGSSIDLSQTVSAADTLRSNLSASIFSIAVGNDPDLDEINGIANNPDEYYVHSVSDFVYLCNLVPAIVPKLDTGTVATIAADCPTEPGLTTQAIGSEDKTSGNLIWIFAVILAIVLAVLLLICCLLYLKKKKKRKPKEVNEAYLHVDFTPTPSVQGKPMFRESTIISNGWTNGVNEELAESSLSHLSRESTKSLTSLMYRDLFHFKPEHKSNQWI